MSCLGELLWALVVAGCALELASKRNEDNQLAGSLSSKLSRYFLSRFLDCVISCASKSFADLVLSKRKRPSKNSLGLNLD